MWRPQSFEREGRELGIDKQILANASATASRILAVDRHLSPLFTLRHLSILADVDYGFLREVVSRRIEDPYRVFRMRKRSVRAGKKRFRIICVPEPRLMQVQRWINRNILVHGHPHQASIAYAPGSSIVEGSSAHCGCAWLIKLDVVNFFESISEIAVYRVFRSLGYQPLMAFELARLCTRTGNATPSRCRPRWIISPSRESSPYSFSDRMGHLPQGAPTSPMLANLAVRGFDGEVEAIARRHGLSYTRYADDLGLSTSDLEFGRDRARRVIGEVYGAMARAGLSPNVTKTRIASPGSRRIMLGLLVDGQKPRLTRQFRLQLRQHLHYIRHEKVGPTAHARRLGFVSVLGFKHYIQGLIAFARQVDPDFGDDCLTKFSNAAWPL